MGCAFQVVSNNVATYLYCTASERGRVTGKFNFGVGTEGGFSGLGGPQVGELAQPLFQQGSESPSELSEFSSIGDQG